MTKRKNITNVKKITSLIVSPKKMVPATHSSLTVTVKGTRGAKYRIVAKNSQNQYYCVDGYNVEGDDGWTIGNNILGASTISKSSHAFLIPIPLTATDEDYEFYVEPKEDTLLSDGVASQKNPIQRKFVSAKTVELEVLETVTNVVSVTTSSGNLSLKPNRKYNVFNESGAVPNGVIDFTIEMTNSAGGNVLSSVEGFNIEDTFVTIFKDNVAIQRGRSDDDYLDEIQSCARISVDADVFDIVASATCRISGRIAVKQMYESNLKVQINLNDIITTS